MELKITAWDGLKAWLPPGPRAPITDEFLKGRGFGCNDNGALNDATKVFIESITGDLDQVCPGRGHHSKVYALSFETNPKSYPDVEKACGKRSQAYWDLLSAALQECQEGVFDMSSPLDEYGTWFDDFSDHFSTLRPARQVVDGKGGTCLANPIRDANWHQFSQSNTIYLCSDWEVGFWDLSKETLDDSVWGQLGEDKFGYDSAWAAFKGQYLDLLGLAMFQFWFQTCCGPDEIMYRWRWSLGQHLGSDIEDIMHELGELAVLRHCKISYPANPSEGFIPTKSMGWADPKEFAADSDANVAVVPDLLRAVKRLRAAVVESIAETVRREEDVVVVTSSGDPVVFRDNGRTPVTLKIQDYILERLKKFPYEGPLAGLEKRALLRDPALGTLVDIIEDAALEPDALAGAKDFISEVNAKLGKEAP